MNAERVAPSDLVAALVSAKQPIVVGHVNPDADALGAMLALAWALPAADAAIALADAPISGKLLFMLDIADVVPRAHPSLLETADVVVVVDTASAKRINVTGGWPAVADKTVVNIDHHITNTDFGAFNWVVDNASSTSELVYRLVRQMDWPMTAGMATLLYAGIYADTCGFSLPTVTGETMDVAAALVRIGADVGVVGDKLVRSHRRHDFDLVRTVYANTNTAVNDQVAYSTLSHAEIIAAGCNAEDIDDQVSIPRSLSGVRIAVLFSEGEPGVIRVNLRGEGGTVVLPLAEKLGGGGHQFSAGVRIRGTIEDAVKKVLAEAENLLGASKSP